MTRPAPSRFRAADASSSPERVRGERGFTLIEVLICTLILTVGLIAIAGLLLVATQMEIGSRESARSMRLAQDKLDELSGMNFDDPAVTVGGDLDESVTNYSDTPVDGVTVRWEVTAGPTDDLRYVTLRVVNLRAQQYRETELTTMIRRW